MSYSFFLSDPQAGDGQVSFCYTLATILSIGEGSNSTFTQGDIGQQYVIFVTNVGSESTTAPVIVTDTLPAGLTATAIGGTGWTGCTATPVVGPGTLSCQRTDPIGGNDDTVPLLLLTVNVASDAPAMVTNTAQVTGGGGMIFGDGIISASTPVLPAAIAQVPALSGAGLVTLAALLSGLGVLLIARRRATEVQ